MASVSKRSWTYKGEVKTAWVVRYKDRTGSQRQETFELKKQADARRRKIEEEIGSGFHVPATRAITMGDLIDQYLRNIGERHRAKQGISQSYLNILELCLRKRWRPLLADLRAPLLDFATLEALAVTLKQRHRLSHGFLVRHLECLRLVLQFGIKRRYVQGNVASELLDDYPEKEPAKITVFDKAGIAKLMAFVEAERPCKGQERSVRLVRAGVYLAAFCGLRSGEILGLTWGHVDWDNRMIRVRNTMTVFGEHKDPKTKAGVRDVPMPEVVVEALRAWEPFALSHPLGLVFTANNGNRIVPSTFNHHHWRMLLLRAGMAPFEADLAADGRPDYTRATKRTGASWMHFHALRHFYASMLIDGQLPVTEVAAMMGHSRVNMTLSVYAHAISGPSVRTGQINAMVRSLQHVQGANDAQERLSA